MRILFVCHRFPYPPNRGGKIRPFNIIKHFGSQGHDVTVASLARSADEAQAGAGLRDHCSDFIMEQVHPVAAVARMVQRLPTPVPSSMGYFYSPQLAKRIQARMQHTHFDMIFVHCSSAAQYVEDIRGIPKVLDFGDMDSQKWLIYATVHSFPLSLGYRIEGTKMQRAEVALARKFDYCTCTTKAEWQTLESFHTGVPSGWFPNGVDSTYFHPAETPYEDSTICFIGRFDYFPNQMGVEDFCTHTLPLLRAERPGIKLLVVGASPSARIRKLGELPGVTVTGSVPDVRPYMHRSAVSIAPLTIARGTQNKILESMAMGVPVVSSTEAAGGVDAVAGEHLLIASTPQEYRDAILRLLRDRDERMRVARAARARVLSHHNWQGSLERMCSQLTESLPGYRGTPAQRT